MDIFLLDFLPGLFRSPFGFIEPSLWTADWVSWFFDRDSLLVFIVRLVSFGSSLVLFSGLGVGHWFSVTLDFCLTSPSLLPPGFMSSLVMRSCLFFQPFWLSAVWCWPVGWFLPPGPCGLVTLFTFNPGGDFQVQRLG